jgi:hypothetical protein
MKKIATIVGVIVGLFSIVGGIWAVDSTYTRDTEFCQLRQQFNYQMMSQRARELQVRMWDLERQYGDAKARSLREYKQLRQERQMILRELQR